MSTFIMIVKNIFIPLIVGLTLGFANIEIGSIEFWVLLMAPPTALLLDGIERFYRTKEQTLNHYQ